MFEVMTVSIGKSIAKAILNTWLEDKSILKSLALDFVDIVADRGKETAQRTSDAIYTKSIGQQIAERMKPIFEHEVSDLPPESHDHLALELAQTLLETQLSATRLISLNLDPHKLLRVLKEARPEIYKDFSSTEVALYNRMLKEASYLIVETADQLTSFVPTFSAKSLKSQDKITEGITELLQAPSKEAEEFERKYLHMLVNHLDRMEMFGVRRMDEISRQQRLSIAYISLKAQSTLLDPYNYNYRFIKYLHAYRDKYEVAEADIVVKSFDLKHEISITFGEDVNLRLPEFDEGDLLEKYLELAMSYRSEGSEVSINDFIRRSRRIIVSGDAGSGKTTLLQWMAVRAANQDFPDALSGLNKSIPFFIRLRERVNKGFPTLDEFPLPFARIISDVMPKSWTHRQLDIGRALVLIDGVDELPENQRNEMLSGLSDLVSVYPLSRYIITSRPHALKDWKEWKSWATDESFTPVSLQPMSEKDIGLFIDHWHQAYGETDLAHTMDTDVHTIAAGLKREIKNRVPLRRLANNPLLCAMICALYVERQQSLPEERIKLYEECVEMLLERRDIGRKIPTEDYPSLSYHLKLDLIQDLAHWMMRNGYSDAQVEEVDDHFSENLPESLIGSTTGSSIRRFYVERTNLIREPIEGRIDFTHRTFQEFLAAKAAIKQGDIGLLVANARDDQWRETIILASGIAGIQRPKDRSKLLKRLISKAKSLKRPSNRYPVLSLVIACLENEVGLDPEVRDNVLSEVEPIIPPKDEDMARHIAKAGDPAVQLLLPKPSYSGEEASLCIKSLAMIGTTKALQGISEYSGDSRIRVRAELSNAWQYFDRKEFVDQVLSTFRTLVLNEGSMLSETHLLPQLQALIVNRAKHSDLQYIGRLKRLRKLKVFSINIRDLSFLSKLNNLEFLDIRVVSTDDFSPIHHLEDLKVLKIYGRKRPKYAMEEEPKPVEVDLSHFSNLRKLKRLELSGVSIKDLSPIIKLMRLQNLSLQDSLIQKPNQISKLENLSTLDLRSTNISDLHPIETLTNLEKLDIGLTEIDDLTPIKELASLETLIIDFTKIDSLSAAMSMRKLKFLDAGHAPLKDISLFAHIKEIETLYIDGTEIVDFSHLVNLKNLKILDIGHTNVNDLSSLAGLNKLELLCISDLNVSDFSALRSLPNLRFILIVEGSRTAEIISAIEKIQLKAKISVYPTISSDTEPFYTGKEDRWIKRHFEKDLTKEVIGDRTVDDEW